MRRLKRKIISKAFLAALVGSTAAAAEPSAYCRKVQARASADAALLMSPQLVAQGLRSPSVAIVDPALVGSPGVFQLRLGLAFSPLDFFKGVGVGEIADAECERHQAQRGIEALLEQVNDLGKLEALRQQIEYLQAQRDFWDGLHKTANDRLAVRAITVMDFNELEKRVTSLERRVAEQQGEAERVAARAYLDPQVAIATLVSDYARRTHAYERKVTDVRSLSAWQFKLSGGVIPAQSQPRGGAQVAHQVDWYGFSELSFNFGAFNRQDEHYLKARQDEVRDAPYELVAMLQGFHRETLARMEQARRELMSVEKQLASTGKARHLLQQSDAPNSAQAVALMRLEEVWLESEKVYLRALTAELSAYLQHAPKLLPPEKS